MRLRRTLAVFAILLGAVPGQAGPADEDGAAALTLRLRDAPVADVLYLLYELTGQGYVVDPSLVLRGDVELVDKTPVEIEQALEAVGVSLSRPGKLRHATTAGEALVFPSAGVGDVVSVALKDPASVRDLLLLYQDLSGEEVAAPLGALGRLRIFVHDLAPEDYLRAVAATAGLNVRKDGTKVHLWRPAEPGAPLLPVGTNDRHYGHVPYREGEAPRTRSSGVSGLLADELRLTGLVARGGEWAALTASSGRSWGPIRRGQRLYDGEVELVDGERVVVRLESGGRREWHLPPAPPGITLSPQDPRQAIEAAAARRDRGEFDEAERILRAGLGGQPELAPPLRAALGDLHYAWGQALLERRAVPQAVRQFEAAHEIDRVERPWQAGEDLNEIGFAWTSIGEPERAFAAHRQALDLVGIWDLRDEPTGGHCTRTHPRSSWVEPSALNGLANAERARGHFREAKELYGRALVRWRKTNDAYGVSAALTGLGLVHQALGEHRRALERHQEAARPLERHPWARAAVLNNVGSAQLALGRHRDAAASFEKALADYRLLGDRAGESTVLNNLGALAESRGEPAEACLAYEGSLAAAREADDRRGQAVTLARIEALLTKAQADGVLRCREALVPSPQR